MFRKRTQETYRIDTRIRFKLQNFSEKQSNDQLKSIFLSAHT